eukprot:5725288-Ditylum_brightwellii.AAC.1
MARAKPKTKGKDSIIREVLAEQGHHDCICTADCIDADKVEHNEANNYSGCASDWYSCTCIHPAKYKACKTTETKLKPQCSNNKSMKCSH